MTYEVWCADLNSIYNQADEVGEGYSAVLVEVCHNYIIARQKVDHIRTSVMAAWIQDVEGNVVP
jgi:hypothetical protein